MYQLVNALLEPYTFLLLVLFGVLCWQLRGTGAGIWLRRSALTLVGLLILLSTPTAGYLAIGSLEWPYPPSVDVPTKNDVIVVLAGDANVADRAGTRLELGDETLQRCWHALQLYRRGGQCRIIVAGGRVPGVAGSTTLAELMSDFFEATGVPRADIVLEGRSTTTYENARHVAELLPALGAERIFLVTSATHMRRAERCFRRQNFNLVPSACNHKAFHLQPLPYALLPTLGGMRGVQTATHEWLGLWWYWLRSRI